MSENDEITLEQLKEQIDQAKHDESLPPWVSLLLSMLWVTLHGLNKQLESILHTNQELTYERDRLRRELYGKKSERSKAKRAPKKQDATRKRKPRDPKRETLSKTALPEEVQKHEAPKQCPQCGGDNLRDLKVPKEHIEYKLRPATLIRVRHQLQKCVCANGCTIVTAPSPDRVGDSGTRFAPSVYAEIIASRTFDAIPFSRQSDRWKRMGIPLNKSTISDLFHRGSAELRPIYDVMLQVIQEEPLLHADETPQPYLKKRVEDAPEMNLTHLGYTWVFASKRLAVYVFAQSRRGEIAEGVLKGTSGHLVADGYQGYNGVIGDDGRIHVGCMAHARKNFRDATSTSLEIADDVLELIKALYRVEGQVKQEGLEGSEEHLNRRQSQSAPIMQLVRALIDQNLESAPPKSPIGKALKYMHNQWGSLTEFLQNASIPLDNNFAERLLRRIAVGRKNSHFMYTNSGSSYEVAYSLVHSCRLNGINPEVYLADVLLRVKSARRSEMRELLPDLWKPPDGKTAARWV
jgi:transposase